MTQTLDDAARAAPEAAKFEVCHDVSTAEWQSIADRCPYATFFHTPVWLRSFAESDPAVRIATKRFRFADGTVAVFPLLERARILSLTRTFEAGAAGCYGGWISPGVLRPEQALAITRWIFRQCPNLVWRVNPFEPRRAILEPHLTERDSAEVLDLGRFPDEQSLRMNYRHSVRKQVNKGCRSGLSARTAERWEEWELYFRIYRERLAQWGAAATSSYPIDLFHALFRSRGEGVKLWVVLRDGKIIGGNLNFYFGRHCVEWHAVYQTEYFPFGVRDFLVDWIIRDARSRGYVIYDFNPSGGHEGTRRFKESFGTTSVPSDLIVRRSGIYRMDALRQAYRTVRRVTRSREM